MFLRKYEQLVLTVAFLILLLVFCSLFCVVVFEAQLISRSSAAYNTGTGVESCAELIGDEENENKKKMKCELILSGNPAEICRSKQIHQPINESETLRDVNSCTFFHNAPKPSKKELEFPLAFSIMVHKDLWHIARLLDLIYSPQNFYCIHVDAKSLKLQEQVRNLTKCFDEDTVFIASQLEMVYWGGMGVLRGTLNCLKDLLAKSTKWKYFLNLSAQDFPLKTNLELVDTLRQWNGANNVEVAKESNPSRYLYHHDIVYSKRGKFPDSNIRTKILKHSTPRNLSIFKGNLAVALSRTAAKWLMTDETVTDLSAWLEDTDIPDEHFFSTIFGNANGTFSHNESILTLYAPYMVRYSVWRPSSECGGKFLHDVCVFGVSDVKKLTERSSLFINKLYSGFQSWAYKCLSEWFLKKQG